MNKCVMKWIKQEVTAVESLAARTLNAASFMRIWSETSEEINWQDVKFKFDIPTRVWQKPLSIEPNGPQWERGSCRDLAGSGEQGPHLIVFLVLREQGSLSLDLHPPHTEAQLQHTHTHTQDHNLSQRRSALRTYCSGVTFIFC